jgi:acyl-CoA reductase-like NAD-dependent aldehyde dehydrogenase
VERHVDDARARGATALTGGSRVAGDGLFYPPTVLADVDHEMACMREETFGPTLPIMRVRDEDEAVTLANSSEYGLSASVWTADTERGNRIAARLDAGAVNVNSVLMNLFQMGLPQGGWKDSGMGGRLGGPSGIHKYCREKAVLNERVPASGVMFWYPASPWKTKVTAAFSRALGARDWRRRLGIR